MPSQTPTDEPRSDPITANFNLDGQTELQVEKHPIFKDDEAQLLHWHHRLNHLPFKRIQAMAKQSLLPKKLAHSRIPLCSGCAYGKATKKPWRTKAKAEKTPKVSITKPGDCISMDQLESSTPGLVAQLKGIPTKARYCAATVFVDHYSGLAFVYLQRTLSSEETVQAKHAFEAFASSHGVTIKHYHGDNGRFQDNAFRESILRAHQGLSFCGVNAHFQNGIAEKRIRDLQDLMPYVWRMTL